MWKAPSLHLRWSLIKVALALAMLAGCTTAPPVPPASGFDVEVENFAGTGEARPFDAAETTHSLGQLIETNDNALVVGVTLLLPVFDGNRRARAATEAKST